MYCHVYVETMITVSSWTEPGRSQTNNDGGGDEKCDQLWLLNSSQMGLGKRSDGEQHAKVHIQREIVTEAVFSNRLCLVVAPIE